MREQLTDEQVAHGVTPCYPGFTNDLAREVQAWRALIPEVIDLAPTISFLASVIRSGEPCTAHVEEAVTRALAIITEARRMVEP